MCVCGSTAGNLNMTEDHFEVAICEATVREAIVEACLLENFGMSISTIQLWLSSKDKNIFIRKYVKIYTKFIWNLGGKSILWGKYSDKISACHHHLFLPCHSCGRTRLGHDSWTAPCSRRWRCSGPGDTEPPTCRSWLAHPGKHAAPGMGASWVGRRTRPALKALILAWEYYSNQTRGTSFLDPEWQASFCNPQWIIYNICGLCVGRTVRPLGF